MCGVGFERAFPCAERPSAYHSLFEVQRYNNIVVKRWLVSERKKRIRSEREAELLAQQLQQGATLEAAKA